MWGGELTDWSFWNWTEATLHEFVCVSACRGEFQGYEWRPELRQLSSTGSPLCGRGGRRPGRGPVPPHPTPPPSGPGRCAALARRPSPPPSVPAFPAPRFQRPAEPSPCEGRRAIPGGPGPSPSPGWRPSLRRRSHRGWKRSSAGAGWSPSACDAQARRQPRLHVTRVLVWAGLGSAHAA